MPHADAVLVGYYSLAPLVPERSHPLGSLWVASLLTVSVLVSTWQIRKGRSGQQKAGGGWPEGPVTVGWCLQVRVSPSPAWPVSRNCLPSAQRLSLMTSAGTDLPTAFLTLTRASISPPVPPCGPIAWLSLPTIHSSCFNNRAPPGTPSFRSQSIRLETTHPGPGSIDETHIWSVGLVQFLTTAIV